MSPSYNHSLIAGKLIVMIGKQGNIPFPELTLELDGNELRPDICLYKENPGVVLSKDEVKYNKAPDLAVEIRSKSQSPEDLIEKGELYNSLGIPECWVVEPLSQTVFLVKEGKYELRRDQIEWNDIRIDLNEIFR